jgi:putative transposase
MITWRARAYKPCEAASSAVYLTNQAKSGTRRSPAVLAPRMNAVCERLAGVLRRELPDRVLTPGERRLRSVLAEYQVRCNMARPRQGIARRVPGGEHDGNHLIVADLDRERIIREPVLRGLINEYARAA